MKRGHEVEMGVRLHCVTQFQNQILCLAVCRGVCEHASPCGHSPIFHVVMHVTKFVMCVTKQVGNIIISRPI